MSLEKKRREVGRLEGALAAAAESNPAVGLDSLLLSSGLMPLANASFPLRDQANLATAIAQKAQAVAADFRFGNRKIDSALAELRKLSTQTEQAPFHFELLGHEQIGPEPRTGPRPRRWRVGDGQLTYEVFTRKQWLSAKTWRFDAKALGVPAAVARALAHYLRMWDERDEQTESIDQQFKAVYSAWSKHPARKQYDEYHVIHGDSPLAHEMRRVTEALRDAQQAKADFDDVTRHARRVAVRAPQDVPDMFRGSPSLLETSAAILAALQAIQERVPASRLDPWGPGQQALAAKYQAPQMPTVERELEFRQGLHIVDRLVGEIDALWKQHPVRVRTQALFHASLEQGAHLITDLADQQERIDEINRAAGFIGLEYADGTRSLDDTLAALRAIRDELAAIPGQWHPSCPTYLAKCAETMAKPRPFSDAPARRLRIDSHELVPSLAAMEGEQWLASQYAHPDNPEGVLANQRAWRVLRDLGPDAEGLEVSDLLDDGGTIHGDYGRLYEVSADGAVALVSSSATQEAIEAADAYGIPVR